MPQEVADGTQRRRVHLLLSAGGVRCFSYIGALEQLEARGYEIATVATCSAGTFVGALYCCGVSPSAMREAALAPGGNTIRRVAGEYRGPRVVRRSALAARVWTLASPPFALYRDAGITRVFGEVLARNGLDPDPTLGELRLPLSTAAVDVAAGRLLAYSSGANPDMRVSELLSIATAVPLAYAPHLRGDREILDASVASAAPIWLATGQPESLPIVVLRTREARAPDGRTLGSWLNRVLSGAVAGRDTLLLERLPQASVYDIPSRFSAFDFSLSRREIEELIDSGAYAVADAEERRQEALSGPVPDGGDDEHAEQNADALYAAHLDRVARSRPATIFVSYADEDRPWVVRLRPKLHDLLADSDVSVWDDSYIKSGLLWRAAIDDAIRRARVAVLFVSESFEASEFIQKRELPLLREQVPPGRTLWVSVDGTRPSGPEEAIQAVGRARPLSGMHDAEADRVLTELGRRVEEAARA